MRGVSSRFWFTASATSIELHPQIFNFRYRNENHFIEYFRQYYGPVQKAYDALGDKSAPLDHDLRTLLRELNTAQDGTLIVPSAYVDVVIRKR